MARQLDERLTDDDRSALHARAVLETSDQPADEITSYAKQAEIDLIVMGTHGRDGLAQLLVGSVAERVVRTAPCPSDRQTPGARIRPSRRCWSPAGSEAVMIALKNDSRRHRLQRAVRRGAELRPRARAHLRRDPARPARRRQRPDARVRREGVRRWSMPELQRESKTAAQRSWTRCSSTKTAQLLRRRSVVVTVDRPAAAIVDYARDASDRSHRHGHARPRRRRAPADGQCRRARRPDRAVSGADGPPSRARIRRCPTRSSPSRKA